MKRRINELVRVDDDGSDINQAKKDKQSIQIGWDNGVIFPNSNPLKVTSFGTIYLSVSFANKVVWFFPMDDRSDFRFIKRLQQAISDLIKSGIIDSSWKIKIVDNDSTEKNIGGLSVKTLLKYDSNFVKKIPICFHGTTDEFEELIGRFGLVPYNELERFGYEGRQMHDKFYTEKSVDNIYLTIDFDVANSYAKNAAKKIGGKPIVLVIKDLDTTNITADDDLLTNVGFAALISMLSGGSKYKTYIDSIRANSNFAYKGRIPANKIVKTLRVK